MPIVLEVVRTDDRPSLMAVREPHREVWGVAPDSGLPIHVLQGVIASGGLVIRADMDGTTVGVFVGFSSFDPTQGCRFLYVHNLGVAAAQSGRGIGFNLMRQGLVMAETLGFSSLRLVFDPLDHRNARFYFGKLNAKVISYNRDYWGDMRDALNIGRASDRFLVEIDRVGVISNGSDRVVDLDSLPGIVGQALDSTGYARWAVDGCEWMAIRVPTKDEVHGELRQDESTELDAFRRSTEGALNAGAILAGVLPERLGHSAYLFRLGI